MNQKEPNESEYHEWSRRILEDIKETSSKLDKLKLTRRLIIDRCVILDSEGRIDYELSLNLWHSKNADAAWNSNNLEPQIDIVSRAQDGGIKKIKVTEFVKKKGKSRLNTLISPCQNGCEKIRVENGEIYHTEPPSHHSRHGTPEVE